MEVSKLLSAQTINPSFSDFEQSFQKTFSNTLLPILDKLSQIYLPFQFFEYIQIFFCILQFFQTTFWTADGKYWKPSKFADILHYISLFSSFEKKSKENIIIFGVFFTIIFIVSVSFLILLIHYKKTRRINRPILYLIRIYFMLFGAVILHPFSSMFGHLLNQVIENKKGSDMVLLAFTFIGFSMSELLFYVFQRFVNESIYIHKSLFVTFDSTLLIFLFMWNPLFLFLSHLFKYYPNWSFFILIVTHAFMIVLSMINYIWMSFIIDFGNILSASILCSLVFNDVFRILVENFHIRQEIFVSVCLIFFIVMIVSFYFIFRFARAKVNKVLSYSTLLNIIMKPYEPTNEEKYVYFYDLKLNENTRKAMIYLQIGFTTGSDMFVDFSLPQYCIDCYRDNPTMILLLIRLMSYFKDETNRFDTVLREFHSLRGSSFFGSFLYFQAHRIKVFRQVTSTNYSYSQLSELKAQTNDMESQIRSFWSLQTATKNNLCQLETQLRNLNNFWEESLEYNWSSVTFREQHIRFLIESCTDFQKAVQMERFKEKIDTITKDRDDLCFLSLVLCFPRYVNRKIIDREGNLLTKKVEKDTHSTTSTVSSHERISTSSNEYDFTQEEQMANSILTYGRLRLSMQNALDYVKPTMGRAMVIYSILAISISLIVIISLFSLYVSRFDSFDTWNQEVDVLIELRFAYVRSFFCLSVVYGQRTNRFLIKPIKCNRTNDPNRNFIDLFGNFDDYSVIYMNQARRQFSYLMGVLLELATERVDISTLTNLFFDKIIDSNICLSGEIVDQIKWSMEQILNFEILSFAILAEDRNVGNWFLNNSYWCHDVTNFPDVQSMFHVIQNALASDLSNSSRETANRVKIQMYVFGPCHLILLVIPFPIILFLYSKEINYLIKIMLSTDPDHKEQARSNISLTIMNEPTESIPPIAKKSFNSMLYIFTFFAFLSFCLIIIFEELILYYAMEMSTKIRNLGIWASDFSLLRAFLMEVLIELINTVYFVDVDRDYLSIPSLKMHIRTIMNSLERMIYTIMNDTPDSPSAIGRDPTIDQIVLTAVCENPVFLSNLHDSYRCGSLSRTISTFLTLAEKITEEVESYNGVFEGDDLENLYHITFAHAITDLINIGDRYASLQKEEISRYKMNLFLFFICGIVFIAIMGIFISLISVNYKRIFSMAIRLIRRLSPPGLINNSELTNYLLYKKGEEIEMGVTHTIFNNSFDGIICMNLDGIVEIINKSFINDYGYSTEQLVGQLIGTIFDNESRAKLENQLKLIKNHESRDYGEHVICFTNDGRSVPSYITLFAIKGSENSLILVIRDETILLQKKKRLELAKKQSQDLLEQIMPPKVLAMLKEGKSEISFAVPSATVTFVDIVNFSGFSKDLSPQQTMGTLSTLFGAFDTWIQMFPLMTKIKLIGDNYMAACGLFAVDDEPKNHAKQSIDFALLVLNILDDTNIKLNTELQIRIGVNSDGPIIAGVLGTENRVFDIIGDTINVASRLEHKAEPGQIMMSQKTYELVKEFGYRIVPRGEMFLKGKGNMPAYSI